MFAELFIDKTTKHALVFFMQIEKRLRNVN